MPDTPGSLHRAAEIIKHYDGNINRIQFDRRIDPGTVFYEVTASEISYNRIIQDLEQIGYLQSTLKPQSFLKFCVYLPHRPGALYEFLSLTTAVGANISFLDFDDKSRHPDRLTVSLNLEQGAVVERLLDELKSLYRLEIIEYDTSGKQLDDTVFYVRYAQAIRELIGESEDDFLLSFLADTNHMAQELNDRGCDPKQVFESVLSSGRTMKATSGTNFYADVQKFSIDEHTTLFCFQIPCGGNVFLIKAREDLLMIDTGYGIYHHDIMAMFSRYGVGDIKKISRIVVTHADADHCGAAGFFAAPILMHSSTQEIIRTNNRSYGSRSDHASLDEFYTKMINLFSEFNIPKNIECLPGPNGRMQGIFPIIGSVTIGDVTLEILDGFSGHTAGQVFLYSQGLGLLFTADSVINFASLSKERADFSSLAAFLVTSVNVDSENARKERKGLLELVQKTDVHLAPLGKRCHICGGHGAVSVLEEGKLQVFGDIERYVP
ncbi:MAG: MBL fold metallo-hydrolase [Methanomicrobiales archaeon]